MRRHDHLKQKHEDAIKANKEYSKNLLNTIKENTELRTAAEKDAEVLMDTLSTNQVLIEEVKVKDAIIRTNDMLNNGTNETENRAQASSENNIIRCNKFVVGLISPFLVRINPL